MIHSRIRTDLHLEWELLKHTRVMFFSPGDSTYYDAWVERLKRFPSNLHGKNTPPIHDTLPMKHSNSFTFPSRSLPHCVRWSCKRVPSDYRTPQAHKSGKGRPCKLCQHSNEQSLMVGSCLCRDDCTLIVRTPWVWTWTKNCSDCRHAFRSCSDLALARNIHTHTHTPRAAKQSAAKAW